MEWKNPFNTDSGTDFANCERLANTAAPPLYNNTLKRLMALLAAFDDTNEYWWAYIFSAMIFMFFGVLAGYMWAGVDVGMYDEEDEKMYDGEQIREPMMDNARTGSSIAHKRSPAATGQRSAHDVDRLGAALFGADA